ncbi:MAG: hypothetical protein WAV18_11355 [Roseiarcus sp.]
MSVEDRVLKVGTGSGYAAALLGELAREVHSVERHETLADEAPKPVGGTGSIASCRANRGCLVTGDDRFAQRKSIRAFAGYLAAERGKEALYAEEGAILAICEHRCVSIEEIAIKVR